MLFKTKEYLKFLIRSTNQHGVHSPFVYSLVTKCFYDRKNKTSYPIIKSISKDQNLSNISFKNLKLIHRLLYYFDYQKILILETSTLISQLVLLNDQVTLSKKITDDVYDFIYFDFKNYKDSILESLLSRTHNNSLLIFNQIHQTEKNIEIWNLIKRHPKVRVTIDTFDFGFVFFRKEQAKEHFVIRP